MDRKSIALALGALLTAAGAAGGHVLREHRVDPREEVRLERFPIELPPYRGVEMEVTERVLQELRSDGLLLREYTIGEDPAIWVYVDYHRAQRMGAQIHSPRNCYPGAGWTVLDAAVETRRVAGRSFPVCWLTLGDADGFRRVALFWFETRWGTSTSELALKRDLLRSAFGGRPTDAALIRFSTDATENDLDGARTRLIAFLDQAGGPLADELPFARTPG